VLQAHVLAIEYHGRERNEKTRRRVHPHRLIHYRNNWYLAGYCERAKEMRTFSLDRIGAVEETREPARASDDVALDRLLGASFGIFTGPAKAWAVLRFNDTAARWVADEQWHPDQIGQWKNSAYELQVPYSDPRELVMDILKHGPDVEVIAPADLRDQVAERLRAAANKYGTWP
jgi:predicted DNA-binding transcriptional regulator YafY